MLLLITHSTIAKTEESSRKYIDAEGRRFQEAGPVTQNARLFCVDGAKQRQNVRFELILDNIQTVHPAICGCSLSISRSSN